MLFFLSLWIVLIKSSVTVQEMALLICAWLSQRSDGGGNTRQTGFRFRFAIYFIAALLKKDRWQILDRWPTVLVHSCAWFSSVINLLLQIANDLHGGCCFRQVSNYAEHRHASSASLRWPKSPQNPWQRSLTDPINQSSRTCSRAC